MSPRWSAARSARTPLLRRGPPCCACAPRTGTTRDASRRVTSSAGGPEGRRGARPLSRADRSVAAGDPRARCWTRTLWWLVEQRMNAAGEGTTSLILRPVPSTKNFWVAAWPVEPITTCCCRSSSTGTRSRQPCRGERGLALLHPRHTVATTSATCGRRPLARRHSRSAPRGPPTASSTKQTGVLKAPGPGTPCQSCARDLHRFSEASQDQVDPRGDSPHPVGATRQISRSGTGGLHRTLFGYFETKTALVNELCVVPTSEMGGAATDGLWADTSPREQVRSMWDHWIARAVDDPDTRRAPARP